MRGAKRSFEPSELRRAAVGRECGLQYAENSARCVGGGELPAGFIAYAQALLGQHRAHLAADVAVLGDEGDGALPILHQLQRQLRAAVQQIGTAVQGVAAHLAQLRRLPVERGAKVPGLCCFASRLPIGCHILCQGILLQALHQQQLRPASACGGAE